MPYPTQGQITQGYGASGATVGSFTESFNKGIDIGAPIGTPVYSTVPGVVIYVGDDGAGWGTRVIIQDAYGNRHSYGHLSATNVDAGQEVYGGTNLGAVGNTGLSTGPHLSYDVSDKEGRYFNPAFILAASGPDEANRQLRARGQERGTDMPPGDDELQAALDALRASNPGLSDEYYDSILGLPVGYAAAHPAQAAAPTAAPATPSAAEGSTAQAAPQGDEMSDLLYPPRAARAPVLTAGDTDLLDRLASFRATYPGMPDAYYEALLGVSQGYLQARGWSTHPAPDLYVNVPGHPGMVQNRQTDEYFRKETTRTERPEEPGNPRMDTRLIPLTTAEAQAELAKPARPLRDLAMDRLNASYAAGEISLPDYLDRRRELVLGPSRATPKDTRPVGFYDQGGTRFSVNAAGQVVHTMQLSREGEPISSDLRQTQVPGVYINPNNGALVDLRREPNEPPGPPVRSVVIDGARVWLDNNNRQVFHTLPPDEAQQPISREGLAGLRAMLAGHGGYPTALEGVGGAGVPLNEAHRYVTNSHGQVQHDIYGPVSLERRRAEMNLGALNPALTGSQDNPGYRGDPAVLGLLGPDFTGQAYLGRQADIARRFAGTPQGEQAQLILNTANRPAIPPSAGESATASLQALSPQVDVSPRNRSGFETFPPGVNPEGQAFMAQRANTNFALGGGLLTPEEFMAAQERRRRREQDQFLPEENAGTSLQGGSTTLEPIAAATGYTGVVNKPTLFMAGEVPEYVNIDPLERRRAAAAGGLAGEIPKPPPGNAPKPTGDQPKPTSFLPQPPQNPFNPQDPRNAIGLLGSAPPMEEPMSSSLSPVVSTAAVTPEVTGQSPYIPTGGLRAQANFALAGGELSPEEFMAGVAAGTIVPTPSQEPMSAGVNAMLNPVVPAAHGFTGMVTSPTPFLAGERGQREIISRQPMVDPRIMERYRRELQRNGVLTGA